MVSHKFFNLYKRSFAIILLFLINFLSINAVVLQPGIDFTLDIEDSSKGIWWSQITINAQNTLNAGDIIEMDYSVADSTDIGLFPLFLKFPDSDTLVCVNEKIQSDYSKPICFRNNNIEVSTEGFNFTLPETINLFDSKTYDIVWGKYAGSLNNVDLNLNATKFVNRHNNTGFDDYFNFTSNDGKLSDIGFNSRLQYDYYKYSQFTAQEQENTGWIYLNNINGYLDKIYSKVDAYMNTNKNYITYTSTAQFYFNGATQLQSVKSGNYQSGGTDTNDAVWDEVILTDNPRVYHSDNSCTTGYSCTARGTFWINFTTYQNNITINATEKFDYCDYLISGDSEITNVSCVDDKLSFVFVQNEEDEIVTLRQAYLDIVKESDDSINGVELLPHTTNGDYQSFVTIKAEDTTTLFFDLYDLNVLTETDGLDSYLQTGTNKILTEQVNDEGYYWIFFKGQYNLKPVVQGIVATNTSSFKKSTKASCSGGTYFDGDGDVLGGQEYAWFKNDVQTEDGAVIDLSTTTFAKGDVIKCGKRFSDGSEWGDWVYSTEYIIQDTEPSVDVTIVPLDPQPSDDLICSFSNYSDLDSDALVSQSMYWMENGVVLNSSTGTSVTLSNSIMENNKIYECVVKLNQGLGSYNISKVATLTNLPPELTSIKTPASTYSNLVSIPNFCTGTDINNDQLYWTFEYSTNLATWNSIVSNSTSSSLNWDVSLLPDNTYYLRCKVNDGYEETNYSSSVSLKVVNFGINHVQSSKAFATTTLTLTSSSPSNMDQYTGGTTGIFCGDFNGETSECYFYTPIKFDGAKNLYYIDVTPYQYSEAGTIYATGFTKNVYDAMVYEVSNIGDIPSTSPILRKTGVTFEMDKANRINLNVVPSTNLYAAVKICVNSEIDGSCGVVDNGDDDLVFLYGKPSGSYIMKTRQGSMSSTTSYDPNVEFFWQDTVSDNLGIVVNELYGDNLLEPLLVKNADGDDICVHSELSSFYPIVDSDCISKINDSSFKISIDDVSKAVSNEYDILWGKVLDISGLTYNDAVLRPISPSSDVRMIIYGKKNDAGSATNNIGLSVNGQDIWSYPASLTSQESVSSVKQHFNVLLNSMVWKTNSPGKIIYHFEPYYIDFDVNAPSELDPVNNGIAPFKIDISTNLDISTTLSYCKLEGNGVTHQVNAFTQTSIGEYSCEPAMDFSDLAGSYKWTVHIQDANGQLRETDGFFTYNGLQSYTVTNLDFGEIVFDNNSEELESELLIENTGNEAFTSFTLEVVEDKFWHESEKYYYEYEDKIGYAPTREQLDSLKAYEELDVEDENYIYNGTLNPNNNFELWWRGTFEKSMEEGSWTTTWSLEGEVDE